MLWRAARLRDRAEPSSARRQDPADAGRRCKTCKLAIGHVMAEVFDRLAEPIALAHPELRYWA
jgi:hypothetical protein